MPPVFHCKMLIGCLNNAIKNNTLTIMSLEMRDLDQALKLSYLDITDEEKAQFLPQLQRTLGFMNDLDQLDLYGVEPSAYAGDQAHYLREDVVNNQNDLFLEKNAPSWEAGCFSVPKMAGEASA